MHRNLVFVIALAAGCGVDLDETESETTQAIGGGTLHPSGPYATWAFPNDLWNLDVHINITLPPAANDERFWSTSFWFAGGNQAYMGLQNAGDKPGGGTGKIAIASVWGATGATAGNGATCMTFNENGPGYTCRIAYDWVPGHDYRTRAWVVGTGQWIFAVADINTGVEQVLGTISVPTWWGNISTANMLSWTEYPPANNAGGLLVNCGDLPQVSGSFTAIGQGGTQQPVANGYASNNECHNTVLYRDAPTTVREVFGGTTNSWLAPGQSLSPNQGLWSQDGRTLFINQGDGNLVVYHDGRALWASRTNSSNPGTLFMQTDGNLVLYTPWMTPVWYTATQGVITNLLVQNDCNVVLYQNSAPVWHTNTWGCVSRL